MARPLGCLTATALLAAGLATAAILAIAVATGNAIFSPGELSAAQATTARGGVMSHAQLSGRCDACHPAIGSGRRMSELCLACHTEVASELASSSGLHGTLAGSSDCRECHTDHRGRTASLTVIDLAQFPHDRMGFSLRAHSVSTASGATTCKDCHPSSLSAFAVSSCQTCHQRLDASFMAQHTTDFGTSCLGCHDGLETYGKAFSHATFPLTAGHGNRTCNACHHAATTLVALKDAPTTCVGCHKADDAHHGSFGSDCAACHTPTTWSDATFDHAKSGFPLTGAHAATSCQQCHVGGVFTTIPTACVSCHARPASHTTGFSDTCQSCHTTTAWTPATFNGPHSFPMSHGGASGVCSRCHPSTFAAWSCAACHSDASMASQHSGISGYTVTGCVRCHPTGSSGG